MNRRTLNLQGVVPFLFFCFISIILISVTITRYTFTKTERINTDVTIVNTKYTERRGKIAPQYEVWAKYDDKELYVNDKDSYLLSKYNEGEKLNATIEISQFKDKAKKYKLIAIQ